MNNKLPLVSVIVPVYGVEKYIERCARSIYEQTYENLEIIFVNDCTPDKSIEILNNIINKYPNRKSQTRIINHEHNKGLAGSRLTGLNASTGYYIQNIDSDDYLDKNMIDEMVTLAEKESADITICDFMHIYPNHTKHLHVNPSLNPHILLQQVLAGEVHSSVCNKLIKRSLYFDNNIFPIEGLNMREDLSVMFRLLYFAKKIAYIPEPYYQYFKGNENSYTSSKMNIAQQNDAYKLILLMQRFTTNCPISITLSKFFNYFYIGTLAAILIYGDTKEPQVPLVFPPHRITIKEIITHPNLHIYRKFACLCYKGKLFYFIKKIQQLKRKYDRQNH